MKVILPCTKEEYELDPLVLESYLFHCKGLLSKLLNDIEETLEKDNVLDLNIY